MYTNVPSAPRSVDSDARSTPGPATSSGISRRFFVSPVAYRRLNRKLVCHRQARCRFLSAHVNQLLDLGDHCSLQVPYLYCKGRLIFRQRLQLLTNVVELRVGHAEFRAYGALPGLAVANCCRFIPHDVLAAEIRHHHEHVESVGHGKERSTEMRAHVIG